MGKLVWDAVGSRFYETGVDRGVLYVDGQPGVAWNGLKTITQNSSGGETQSYYYDGTKYLDTSSDEEFSATIEAYTYPEEFEACDGTGIAFSGVFVSQQKRKTFGLSYRTRVGNDSDETQHGYKIHLVYGCLASPSDRAYSSANQSPEPISFSWNCTSKRLPVGNGFKPSAHIVIDSSKITSQALQIVEGYLYGTDSIQSYLPSPAELFELFTLNPGTIFSIQYNSVTGLSLLVPAIPGDVSGVLDVGMYVLTDTSHLSPGTEDGTYIWES